jgi:TPR repeat protein
MMRDIACTLLLVAAFAAAAPRLAATAEPTFRDGLRAYDVRDYGRALAIWTRLAGANDAKAQAGLGYMYYAGQGVARDSQRAAELFYPAASQGETTAQFFLALMHRSADGVVASPELSLMWCELAMSGGQPAAFEWHEEIMADLTEPQRREAWRLVAEWYRIRDTAAAR